MVPCVCKKAEDPDQRGHVYQSWIPSFSLHIECSKLFKILEFAVLSIVPRRLYSNLLDCTMHYKAPLKPFRLPSVAILSWLCRKRHKAIFTHLPRVIKAPMAHSYRLGLATWRYQVRIPVGPVICHRSYAYTVLQTFQRHGVYSAAYGTAHYKEP